VPDFRYAQYCPLARAAEVLGERWTLLVVRELLLGPQRFSDLMRRIPGVSSSVLSARVRQLEERGVVTRRQLPPPAASSVIELTELGQGLRPVALAMTTWGIRLMQPQRPGDHYEPSWLRLGLVVITSPHPTPDRKFVLRVPDGDSEFRLVLTGGRGGARLDEVDPCPDRPCDAEVFAPAQTLLSIATGATQPAAALARADITVTGDEAALDDLPAFFSLEAALNGGSSTASAPPPMAEAIIQGDL
jgi:DNA-binding HxlR family transcriptional regulator